MPGETQERSAPSNLIAFVALALLALVAWQIYSGVTLKKVGVPGVFEVELSDKPSAVAAPAASSAQAASVALSNPPSQPAPRPALSRESFGGRWRVDQTIGGASAESVIDYNNDGTFNGWMTQFNGGFGQRVPVQGRWNVDILNGDTFRLTVVYANFARQQATFKVLDDDHIQNIDQNYVAVRVR